jgi:hypothetical protein
VEKAELETAQKHHSENSDFRLVCFAVFLSGDATRPIAQRVCPAE